MMQAASDIFLGWTKGEDRSRHYYWRQLRDMKGSAEIETMAPVNLSFYAGICGVDPGPSARPIRRPRRDRRLPGQQRPVRPVDHRLLPALRGAERAGSSGVHQGDPLRTAGSVRRCLRMAVAATKERR